MGKAIINIARLGKNELLGLFDAWRGDKFGRHVEQRLATGIDATIDVSKSTLRTIGNIGSALISDPKKTAPDVSRR